MPSIRLLDSGYNTYVAARVLQSVSAPANDWLMFSGVNNIKAKFRFLEFGGTTGTTSRSQNVTLIRRTQASSGGTSALVVPAPVDTADPPAQVIATQWSVNPNFIDPNPPVFMDMGTFTLTLGSGTPQDRATFNYEATTLKPVTLSAGNEFLCVSLLGVATTAADKLEYSVWWTEANG